MDWIIANWEWVMLGFYTLEKIVKLSPSKKDDIIFDTVLKPIRWFAYRRLKDLQNMEALEKDMVQWVEELTKQRKKNPFDEKVANALANGEVEMSINKVTNKLV